MTRTAARELAVLICASMSPEETADETLERFFEPEHYASLAGEGEQFAEYPNKKQLAARVLCGLLLSTYLTGGYSLPVPAC